MTTVVLDASVAVKWFLPRGNETLIEEASALAQLYQDGEVSFIVPDLFWAEIANFFWKGVQQKRFEPIIGETAIEILKGEALPTVSSLDLIDHALHIALGFHRSAYDSIYIALALQFSTYLVTADERLTNAVGSRLPVKWLGAF